MVTPSSTGAAVGVRLGVGDGITHSCIHIRDHNGPREVGRKAPLYDLLNKLDQALAWKEACSKNRNAIV